MNVIKCTVLPSLLSLLLAAATACTDDSNIGQSIAKGDVSIEVDSTFEVTGRSVRNMQFDSRSKTLLLGRLTADEYGSLDCSYAGALMPASSLSIPDSIPVESVSGMNLKFKFARNALTGDSLSPQQLTVYRLLRQLPADINNLTDLTDYYNASQALGVKSFTVSSLGAGQSSATGTITIPLDKRFAQEIVTEYRTDPSIFSRPETFADKFAGIYVRSTFGRGLLINMSNTEFTTYYNYHRMVTVVKDGVSVQVDSIFTDSTTLFSISPEVLSANLIRQAPAPSVFSKVAQGECIIQSPGGFNVQITFPADKIIERYYSEDFNLSVVNTLTLEVPARDIPNDYGITHPPYMLMIKTSRLDKFFINNELPIDNDTEVFYAAYNSSTNSYRFDSLRPYIVELMKKGVKPETADMDFTLVPVDITAETVNSGSTQRIVVTGCKYYLARPTLCCLELDKAKVRFTYSRQNMR